MKRALTAVAVILAVGTAAGLAILWPGDTGTKLGGGLVVDTQEAEASLKALCSESGVELQHFE